MKTSDLLKSSNRLVIKIGSALIADIETGSLNQDWLLSLAEDIKDLESKEIIIVSSGAIALGRNSLSIDTSIPTKDLKINQKQAAASIGQIVLLNAFQRCFQSFKLNISQILLNPADTENRRTHLNARSTLITLLDAGFIPIINENDTTATDEIRFGDNDKLAARVAQMVEADTLLILSTTDGLYSDNPFINADAKHFEVIEDITHDILNGAKDSHLGISSGGMRSKVESAQIAVNAGTNVIIASGKDNNPITGILNSSKKSTLFHAKGTPNSARKRWIGAHLTLKGSVILDDGAASALKNGKSLLPVGVIKVIGDFDRGDALEVKTQDGQTIAIGLSEYNSKDASRIKGHQSETLSSVLGYNGRDAFIHRNDLVLK